MSGIGFALDVFSISVRVRWLDVVQKSSETPDLLLVPQPFGWF